MKQHTLFILKRLSLLTVLLCLLLAGCSNQQETQDTTQEPADADVVTEEYSDPNEVSEEKTQEVITAYQEANQFFWDMFKGDTYLDETEWIDRAGTRYYQVNYPGVATWSDVIVVANRYFSDSWVEDLMFFDPSTTDYWRFDDVCWAAGDGKLYREKTNAVIYTGNPTGIYGMAVRKASDAVYDVCLGVYGSVSHGLYCYEDGYWVFSMYDSTFDGSSTISVVPWGEFIDMCQCSPDILDEIYYSSGDYTIDYITYDVNNDGADEIIAVTNDDLQIYSTDGSSVTSMGQINDSAFDDWAIYPCDGNGLYVDLQTATGDLISLKVTIENGLLMKHVLSSEERDSTDFGAYLATSGASMRYKILF